jgi:predicted alpha-1,2-mannosidase
LRRSKFWAGDQFHYFAMEFSRPMTGHKIFNHGQETNNQARVDGTALQAVLDFDLKAGDTIEVKVATSAVSAEGAWKNLEAEATGITFDKARASAKRAWNRYLSKIDVTGGSEPERRIFYTALYHTFLTPNLFQDVDRQYRGMDGAVHTAVGFTNYTVFSLWDTFRALHPLMTILDPKRDGDFAMTLVHMSQQFGEIPMWELAANDTRCMIGYHGVSVIADAYIKGITNIDAEAALAEMKRTAMLDKRGLKDYRTLGFVPANKGSQAVSKTLEYAYDDWCIAQLAKKSGHQADYDYFIARSQFYRNIFDPNVGFMRGKDDAHAWSKPFNPMSPGLNYTEGNAYQYTPFVPQDVPGFTGLLGGKAALGEYLDRLFATKMPPELLDADDDISGLIGQYAHGNEPSHHIAYLYCFAGEPWKTQAMVRKILREQYSEDKGGLDGNDDCGQISAWYVMSALGFYSVCPGQLNYVIGSPLFDEATLRLDNGKKFTIKARNNSATNVYVQSAKLNGKLLDDFMLNHAVLMAGGTLDFRMGSEPNRGWATNDSPNVKAQTLVSAVPYLTRVSDKFLAACSIEIKCDEPDAKVHYTLDGSEPTLQSPEFTAPFDVNATTVLHMRSFADGKLPSLIATRTLTSAEAYVPLKSTPPGLKYAYYEGIYRSVYDFAKDKPVATGIVEQPTTAIIQRTNWIASAFDGLIQIPADGEYTFYVTAKDGGQLRIDGEELFESDCRKDFALPQQATIALRQGYHRFSLKTYKCTEIISLSVEWSGPGFTRTTIPREVYFHESE